MSLTVRFLCEIAAVVAVVWWGWTWPGILAGLALIVLWGLFVAPKARRRLPDPARFALEIVFFAAATIGFIEVGQTALAIVFACAALVTAGLVRVWPEPVSDTTGVRHPEGS